MAAMGTGSSRLPGLGSPLEDPLEEGVSTAEQPGLGLKLAREGLLGRETTRKSKTGKSKNDPGQGWANHLGNMCMDACPEFAKKICSLVSPPPPPPGCKGCF